MKKNKNNITKSIALSLALVSGMIPINMQADETDEMMTPFTQNNKIHFDTKELSFMLNGQVIAKNELKSYIKHLYFDLDHDDDKSNEDCIVQPSHKEKDVLSDYLKGDTLKFELNEKNKCTDVSHLTVGLVIVWENDSFPDTFLSADVKNPLGGGTVNIDLNKNQVEIPQSSKQDEYNVIVRYYEKSTRHEINDEVIQNTGLINGTTVIFDENLLLSEIIINNKTYKYVDSNVKDAVIDGSDVIFELYYEAVNEESVSNYEVYIRHYYEGKDGYSKHPDFITSGGKRTESLDLSDPALVYDYFKKYQEEKSGYMAIAALTKTDEYTSDEGITRYYIDIFYRNIEVEETQSNYEVYIRHYYEGKDGYSKHPDFITSGGKRTESLNLSDPALVYDYFKKYQEEKSGYMAIATLTKTDEYTSDEGVTRYYIDIFYRKNHDDNMPWIPLEPAKPVDKDHGGGTKPKPKPGDKDDEKEKPVKPVKPSGPGDNIDKKPKPTPKPETDKKDETPNTSVVINTLLTGLTIVSAVALVVDGLIKKKSKKI